MGVRKSAIPGITGQSKELQDILSPMKEALETVIGARSGVEPIKKLQPVAGDTDFIRKINEIIVRLNVTGDAELDLEATPNEAGDGGGGSGSVVSVDVSGGNTGLVFAGGPVTSSGVITLQGTRQSVLNALTESFTASVNEVLTRDTNGNALFAPPTGGAFTYSATPPADPTVGDRWVDSDIEVLFHWIDDGDSEQWVEF